jgi:vancomycin resistance protein YoaR
MPETNKKRSTTTLGILLILLVGVLAMAGTYYLQQNTLSEQDWDNLMLTGTYHDGITIDGIDVSGMTVAQAGIALKAKMNERLDGVVVTLKYKDRFYFLTRDDFDISDNTKEVAKEAMRVAREGSRIQIQKEIAEIKKNGKRFFTDYTVNTVPVKARLAAIAAELYQPAQDATVQINKDDRKNRFKYTDEINGIKVDQGALYAAVEEQIRLRQYGTIQIPVDEVPATVTRTTLEAATAQMVPAATSFARSPYNRESRVANIKKAVGIINGYVLAPDAEFSANTVLGPRTYNLGWQPAPAIVRGGSEDQAGGGVCQVSTTLYNAVLKADLEIISRRAHSIKLSYVDGGLDATINTGTIDFVFRNNTGSNVYIFGWVDRSENKVHFEIYRTAFSDKYDEIRVTSEKLETLYPKSDMLVTVDPSKPVGYRETVQSRRNGAVYVTYKHFYKNGEEVGNPVLIAKTTYKAYAGEIVVGPEPIAEAIPKPTAKPDSAVASPTPNTETAQGEGPDFQE